MRVSHQRSGEGRGEGGRGRGDEGAREEGGRGGGRGGERGGGAKVHLATGPPATPGGAIAVGSRSLSGELLEGGGGVAVGVPRDTSTPSCPCASMYEDRPGRLEAGSGGGGDLRRRPYEGDAQPTAPSPITPTTRTPTATFSAPTYPYLPLLGPRGRTSPGLGRGSGGGVGGGGGVGDGGRGRVG